MLSAQVLFDALGDQALQLHGAIDQEVLGPVQAAPIPIDAHLREAHQQSGWNSLQQQFGLKGSGQTVAVIDTGIAWDHVALGKGYGPGYRVVGGWDFTEENDARPYDDGPTGFHGTHVAGIIGSTDRTHTGVAPEADLVALRVFNDFGQGQVAWVERALQWVHTNRSAFENPITTVNLSLGTAWNANTVPNWGTLEEELRQLYDDGIVVVASAGNSFKSYNAAGLSYPAASQYVLPVASVDDNGQLSDYSQRSDRVIAAPGRNIISTVPDHVLGRDGKVNDFSTATGTSMASPYVAGAAVLVREAMQMTGLGQIDAGAIIKQLHDTADSIFDSITASSYDKLNLQRAIDDLIPDDAVGDISSQARILDVDQHHVDGWINRVGDTDVFRFTASTSGKFQLDLDSDWVDSLTWSISSANQTLGEGQQGAKSIHVEANNVYELKVSAGQEIGPYDFDWSIQADRDNPPSGPQMRNNLGSVEYVHATVDGGSALRAQATHDGVFTVQWSNPDAPNGSLVMRDAAGGAKNDTSWSEGMLRIDVTAKAGQWFDIQLPGRTGVSGELSLANVLSSNGNAINLIGTLGSDHFRIDLREGTEIAIGAIGYEFGEAEFTQITIDGREGNDTLEFNGSKDADKVELRPGLATASNSQVSVTALSVEESSYAGGGGADRVYLYDADTDDTLTARPGSAELVGVGYRFSVRDMDRLFVHATAGGEDNAYLHDSAGNDRLSVRPQFTSMSGDSYFNYVRGFERVYAYGDTGGMDMADLYDSSSNDRFSTSGEAASIVGPGFFSYTRFFEQVRAHADSGGQDLATLYGANQQTQWQRGSDFVNYREAAWNREARGFEKVETFVDGQMSGLGVQSVETIELPSNRNSEALADNFSGNGLQNSNQTIGPMTDGFHDMFVADTSSPADGRYAVGDDQQDSCIAQRFDLGGDSHSLRVEPNSSGELRELSGGLVAEVLDTRKWQIQRFGLDTEFPDFDADEQTAILDAVFRSFASRLQ